MIRVEHAPVTRLEPLHERAIRRRSIGGVAQQDVGHRRRDRERHDHRGEHGEPVRDRERLEERAGQAADEEDRDERDDVDQRRVDDRAADFERGRRGRSDAVETGSSLASGLAEAAHDVLDVDDRVVHDDPDGDDEPREDHRVEGRAAERTGRRAAAMSESGIATRLMRAVRHSNRNSDEHDDDEQAAEQQRVAQVADRHPR